LGDPLVLFIQAGQHSTRAKVELVTRWQRVQPRVRHHDRLVAGGLEGVRDDVGAVHDRHGPAPDNFEDVVGVDDRGGVLVEPEADQRGGLRHDREQPAEARTLLEVLIDDDVDQQSETDRNVRHPILRRGTGAAKRHHVGRNRACTGGSAGDNDAAAMGLEDRAAQLGAANHRREPELVAAGHEDAGDVSQRLDGAWIVRLFPGLRPKPDDLRDTEPGKDMTIEVGRRLAQG